MEEIEAIATYLIVKRVTSSQTMIRWLPVIFSELEVGVYSQSWLIQFISQVRKLSETKVINEEITQYLLQYSLWRDEAKRMIEELYAAQVSILLWNAKNYPVRLQQITDKPAILYLYGNISLLEENRLITLVGTRSATKNGLEKCSQYVYEAVHCGYVTVSGLARGIDTRVWVETLHHHGKTIAVVPQLTKEYMNLVNNNMNNCLLISEFPPQLVDMTKWHYIARNRILAALSKYTVVIEAPVRSGTLHTADFAFMYNRELYVSFPCVVLPEAYGGVALAQSLFPGIYVQSVYDVFYLSNDMDGLTRYHSFVRKLSKGKIDVLNNDYRHLATLNVKHTIFKTCEQNLQLFEKTMVELVRFGIIYERKGTILFNFSGFNKWPKTSLL